jgi:hypothetical protein
MVSYDMRELLIPKRVTNAMWDFSWLFGHYPGGPFEDFDKVTDELLERNFNTIRIDCFPWITANMKSLDEEVTMPANPLATWGLMENRLAYAREWGNEWAAPVITTESWGPWWHMDHKDLKWEWLRDWCAECMGMAADYGL